MPSKIPPFSVRLPPPLRVLIEAHAASEGISRQAAVNRLIKLGLERVTLPVTTPTEPKAILAQAEAKAAHLALPKRRRRAWNLKSVQLGPTVPPLGSRLKGATPGKAKR